MTRPDPFTRRTFDAAGNASAGWWARLARRQRVGGLVGASGDGV